MHLFLTILITFLAGALTWAFGFAVGVWSNLSFYEKKMKEMEEEFQEVLLELLDKPKEKKTKSEYPKEVLTKVQETKDILERQMKLMGQASQPSSSATHSKWKNDLIGEIKGLEAEKMQKLKEILEMGYDISMSVYIDGKQKVVKLSEYINMTNETLLKEESKRFKVKVKPVKEIRKLSLVKDNIETESSPEPV